MVQVLDIIGRIIARYLERPVQGYDPFTPSDPVALRKSPLSKYYRYHTRICRPIGLSLEDRRSVCSYAIDRIGFDYDLRNIIDLMRYLVPLPVPQHWRRRMIALGSGNPTRLICSALIAQAFEAVRYPILPKITQLESEVARREILHIRDSSLYVPRDFDISPYFKIVKPMLEESFDYKRVHWADLPAQSEQYIGTSRTSRKMKRQRCAQL